MGWAELADFLDSSDAAPVVTSYTVMDGFPNSGVANWNAPDDDEDDETWGALPRVEQWERSMAGLRSTPHMCRDLSPESLRAPFSHRMSLFDLMR